MKLAREQFQKVRLAWQLMASLLLHSQLTAQHGIVQAIQVPKGLVSMLLQVLRRERVEFVVAPYEADAQLVHLVKTRRAHAVLTEDSDLVTYAPGAGYLLCLL